MGKRDLVRACPECDSSDLTERLSYPSFKRFRCRDCDAIFERAHRRPSKVPSRMGQLLAEMDPDEFSAMVRGDRG